MMHLTLIVTSTHSKHLSALVRPHLEAAKLASKVNDGWMGPML